RTGRRGQRTAVQGALLVSFVAVASLFPFVPMLASSVKASDWVRRVPSVLAALLFISVWFPLFNTLEARSSNNGAAGIPQTTAELPATSAKRLAIRVLLAVAMLWTIALGFIGSACIDFGGDEWLHESSRLSPNGNWRAEVVRCLEPGGALSGTDSEVYLLP